MPTKDSILIKDEGWFSHSEVPTRGSQSDPSDQLRAITPCLYMIKFNIILSSEVISPLQVFLLKFHKHFSSHPSVLPKLPARLILLDFMTLIIFV
jgi:hypothetical protein